MKSMMNCNRFNYNLPTMKREMKKYGLPEPESYEERDSFKVIFRNISVAEISQTGAQTGAQTGVQTGAQYNRCIKRKSFKLL